jgi:hypothetical protein
MSRGGPYEVTQWMVWDAIFEIHTKAGRVCYTSQTLARVIAEQQGFPVKAIEDKVRHHVSRFVRIKGLYVVGKEKPEGGGRARNLYLCDIEPAACEIKPAGY